MRPVSQALASLVAVLAVSATTAPAQASPPPKVVASIGPVGSLTAAVMRGVGEPTVLLPAGASPHAYSLRPSEARALASADLVLWVGEALETFLEEPLETLARKGSVVELMEADGLILLPTRTGGVWAEADEEHDEHGHDHGHGHGGIDAHVWLDPRNAAAIVDRIAAALAERDPGRAAAYRANAATAKAGIEALDNELATALAGVRKRPYVVFHDGYQYFERHYGLAPLGSVTIGPERAPGAQRLAHLRDEILERGAACVFREPQFTPRVLDSLAADTKVRVGVLDPLGADVPAGPDGYAALMRNLAASLTQCLAPAG